MRRTKMWAVSMLNDSTYPWCIFSSLPRAKEEAGNGQEIFPVEVKFEDKPTPKATARALKRLNKPKGKP